MKIWILSFLATFIMGTATYAEMPTDKGIHFGVSATAHAACTALSEQVLQMKSKLGASLSCWFLVNAAGVVKEMSDSAHGGMTEKQDVYANMAGSGFSFVAINISGF